MEIPLQITFKNTDSSGVIENEIRQRARKLERFFDHIMSCRVVVEVPHKHKVKGNQYNIKIDITVPGSEIVVTKSSPDPDKTHKDPNIAIKDAFSSAARQLEDYARKLRGDVKTQVKQPEGVISEINRDEGFGRISTSEGKLIYFHKNSVLDEDFKNLSTGMRVRYAEEEGEKGTQASTVKLLK